MDTNTKDYWIYNVRCHYNLDNWITGGTGWVKPLEYVSMHYNEFLANNIELAISQNTLPVGMNIDYALEILKLCNEKG